MSSSRLDAHLCAHDLDVCPVSWPLCCSERTQVSMSRERDLPSPRPCAPLRLSCAPPLPVLPCSLWHGALRQSGNLDTFTPPPLPVWPGHSPSKACRFCFHTPGCLPVTTSSTWARGTHHALVRIHFCLKALVASGKAASRKLLPLQAFLSHRPVCSNPAAGLRRPGLLVALSQGRVSQECLQLHWRTAG